MEYLLFAWPVLFPVCRRFEKRDMLPTLMREDITHLTVPHVSFLTDMATVAGEEHCQ